MMDKKGLMVANDIDEIILVGGSTRMPQVERRLLAKYNKPITSYEPDKAVAMGAALVANEIKDDSTVIGGESAAGGGDVPPASPTGGTMVIKGSGGDSIELIVKCTKSYGMLSWHNGMDEFIANIIMKDTVKPTANTRRFGTVVVYCSRSFDKTHFADVHIPPTATKIGEEAARFMGGDDDF